MKNMSLIDGTHLPEHDKSDPVTRTWQPGPIWLVDPSFGKKEKLNSFRQKGHNPTIKKVAMLGLAHEADQKLIEKYIKKAELLA